METLSINEKINYKSQKLRDFKLQIEIGGAERVKKYYSYALRNKVRAQKQGYEVLSSSPFFQCQKESERKIDSRFNHNGELTDKWLVNHPEVHHLIFLM